MSSSYEAPDFRLERRGQVSVVALTGELGNTMQARLARVFVEAMRPPVRGVIVDIRDVVHLASFAVAAIGFNYKQLADMGGFLALVADSDQALKPFRLAGLDSILPIFTSMEDAQNALREQGVEVTEG